MNPEVDEIVVKATTATTQRKAKFWWRKFQETVVEDAAYYWPVMQKGLAGIRNDVKGVVVTPFVGLLDLDNAYRQE